MTIERDKQRYTVRQTKRPADDETLHVELQVRKECGSTTDWDRLWEWLLSSKDEGIDAYAPHQDRSDLGARVNEGPEGPVA